MIGIGMSAGKSIASEEHIQVVALYDPGDGRIMHLHMVTTLSGAAPLTQQEAIEEAKVQARRRNPDIEALAVALTDDAAHGYRPHCIDPDTKAFIPLHDDRRDGGWKEMRENSIAGVSSPAQHRQARERLCVWCRPEEGHSTAEKLFRNQTGTV